MENEVNVIVFTKEMAESFCKSANKLKDLHAAYTGGQTVEAAIYNKTGSLSVDYDKRTNKFYMEIDKDINCHSCSSVTVSFESEKLEDFLLILSCIDL
jgi:hypothetical protein